MDAETLIQKIRFKGMEKDEKHLVLSYLRKDHTIQEIAKMLDISPQLVWYHLDKMDITKKQNRKQKRRGNHGEYVD